MDGERARFVSPLALFLFSVFLMFAVFSVAGAGLVGIGGYDQPPQKPAAQAEQLDAGLDRLRGERSRSTDPERAAVLDALIAEMKQERDALAAKGESSRAPEPGFAFKTGWPWLDKGIAKSGTNPDLLLYKLQANAYKFSWALIPLSVPFVWLLFLHRRRYRAAFKAYDHLVFVTYSIAFVSLLLIAIVSLHSLDLGGAWLGWAFVLIPPVHIYRQLRGTYRLSRLSAAWRTAALLFFANIAIGLFLTFLLAVGVLG